LQKKFNFCHGKHTAHLNDKNKSGLNGQPCFAC
jgi:hypothetical protein